MATIEAIQKELADRVRHYEGKLATLSVITGALQKENEELRRQLESQGPVDGVAEEELQDLRAEFSRRLGAADKTISDLKEERDRLRAQVSAATQGGSSSEARLQDREKYVAGLQAEGEALARKNGELEAMLRKLRTSSREQDAERERLAGRVQSLEAQLLQQQELFAQAAQAAALQGKQLKEEVEEVRQQAAAHVREAQRNAQQSALLAQQSAAAGGAQALAAAQEREFQLTASLADLRSAFEAAEGEWVEKEQLLRREVAVLEERVRSLEADKSQIHTNASDTMRPLLRQIESMAAAAAAQHASQAGQQAALLQRVRDAEGAAESASHAERRARARAAAADAAVATAQKGAAAANAAAAEAKARYEAEKRRVGTLQAECGGMEERLRALSEQAAAERQKHEVETRELQERLWDIQEQVRAQATQSRPDDESPVATAMASLINAGSAKVAVDKPQPCQRGDSSPSQQLPAPDIEDELALMLRSMKPLNGDAFRPLDGSKPRKQPGGNAVLEARLAAMEETAARAHEELLLACQRADAVQQEAQRCRELEAAVQAAAAKCAMALELLGERNERVEQLEEDIRDMKAIFHEQLSFMTDQLNALKPPSAAPVAKVQQ
ncbi:hypothetical protein WJX72_009986 [[Myrmecia] bisecta]|uniref:TATA element modulatory factor 1 TATA binding domain-containing protein n=1 Tax=[Myrmecia] bisecta TaxID=41462 RepID=A0AAW1P6N6_9CHLO